MQARVAAWYIDMSPCWLGVDPPARRRLLLCAHQWVSDYVFQPDDAVAPSPEDLGPGGPLALALTRAVTPAELRLWQPWIRLALHDFRRALRWPRERRTDAWCRWLFLIPYSLPARVGASRSRTPRRRSAVGPD